MTQTAMTDEGYRLLRESCGRVEVADTLIRFEGEDRKGWLQGQVTNDLRDFGEGASVKTALLTPTGQIVSTLHLWALPGMYVGLVPFSRKESALERLERMLILEDVQIEVLADSLVSVQGPEASSALSESFVLPRLDAGLSNDTLLLRNDRTGSGGWDVIGGSVDVPAVDSAALDVARLEAGIPVYGRDMGERTLVMEMGRHFVEEHVSFQKGCYTGQEVVMRIHTRGHTNRTWMGLTAEAALQEGAAVSSSERQDAGVVTSAAVSPELGFIGAAMLRNEVARGGAIVRVGEADATVVEMPLRG